MELSVFKYLTHCGLKITSAGYTFSPTQFCPKISFDPKSSSFVLHYYSLTNPDLLQLSFHFNSLDDIFDNPNLYFIFENFNIPLSLLSKYSTRRIPLQIKKSLL